MHGLKPDGINAQQPQRCHNLSRVAIHVPVGLVLVNREGTAGRLCLSESVRKMGRWVLERGGA